jgi:LysR family transcriptional regulator for metE and metH
MLERQHLQILREVARHGGVTAAAERLNLTQSALSHAIRRLEERLGLALWAKEGRRLRPTPAGRHLLALADRLLPQFDEAEAALADFAAGRRGALRIGMECHPCFRWLLRVVAPFLRAWPGVDLDVRQAFRFGGVAALEDREIDLLITPDPVLRPGLSYAPVFDYELMLAVGAGHRLAGRDHATPADLADEILITYPVETERLDVYTQFLIPANRLPRARKAIETTDIMVEMAAAGRGVTALPDWLLAEFAHAGGGAGLRALRLGAEGVFKSIHVGARAEDAGLDYVRGFLDLARATPRGGAVGAGAQGG